MSKPNNRRLPTIEEIPLDGVNSSSSYQDEDGRISELPELRSNPSLLGRILLALGFSSGRRLDGRDYEAAPVDETPSILKRRPARETRRCRRSHVVATLKRATFTVPCLVLMLFGVLHVLQFTFGRARLIWDSDFGDDDFLPDWGKPGHFGAGLADYPTDVTRDVIPVACHSHNDYWRRVPLFDAIHYGCTGVEADVWLFDGELFVGHNTASLTRNRTLTNLYVKPLVDLLDKMNPKTEFANVSRHGVFDVDHEQTLVLLIDFKTDGHETWTVVSEQLEPLREKGYLSHWDGDKVHSRAVTVVGTGNTPFDMVTANTTYRDIFFDAPINKMWEPPQDPTQDDGPAGKANKDLAPLTDDYDTSNSYYASVSFMSTVGFIWKGHLAPKQMDTIRGQIRGAQRRGLKVRYWDTPSWPIGLRNHVWHVLMKEGADVLNADDLRAAATANWRFRVRHHIWN